MHSHDFCSTSNVGSLIYQLIGVGDTAAKTAPHEGVTSSVYEPDFPLSAIVENFACRGRDHVHVTLWPIVENRGFRLIPFDHCLSGSKQASKLALA